MKVELVYEKSCPNIEAARLSLLQAFAEAGIAPHWREWELGTPDAPAHVHGYGSPTILVDDRDVSGDMSTGGDDDCCRIYSHGPGTIKGTPQVADIVHALQGAQHTTATENPASAWRLNGAAFPAVGAALLPKLTCPACWPAYAGLLSSLGVGFFDYTPYLLPLTALFLLIAVAALGYRADRRQGYKPLLLGLLAAGALLLGKFHYDSDAAMYAGLALLMAASLWNTWPKALRAGTPCATCVSPVQEPAKRI